ncbi:MAG: chemotaxis protein CheR [Verrucomicrobia bacterium]|nr:chemotaxis protein CheR [Verrucomicrobiota bacterium]
MISENDILETLRSHAGIDAAQTGEAFLRAEIRRAIQACAHPHRLLDPATPEWQSLLEASLVPETWFFRHPEAFEALARWTTQTWHPAHPGACLRVLSLPCATGEEPFSIAICLLAAGLTPDLFNIRAGDLSENSLARARQAIYRRNSFRPGFDAAMWGGYFDDVGDGRRRVAARVRGLVGFECMNLVKPSPPLPRCEVIFCRNALIYFARETQHAVLTNLREALSDDGILFLGPVEPPVALQCGFVATRIPMAFACTKMPGAPPSPDPGLPHAPGPRGRARLPAPPPPKAAPRAVASVPRQPSATTARPPAIHSLESARSLADAGHLSAAADMLEHLAASEQPTAEFFCLHGLVSEALGRGDLAEASYRKALYLDPAHFESLAHLAALLELLGRSPAAAQLRRRANPLYAP